MANNFNFQTTLKLNSTGFRKGVSQVKSSLAGLKTSFLQVAGALGAGLGFTQLIANLKTTATELSVAKNTLENVSRATKVYSDGVNTMNVEISNYGENLAFVKRLSKDYGQDLVALMTNFAQFTSACKKTDLALEDQKKVYEALTRAAAYYHMSSDRTKDMMNAVTQMMSKGKVAAEELRRQLGNALPGAFNLMAASMGVSNAELDKLMREGKVIAADVLPQFAAMLNSVTQNAHFDSLQTSLNQFKNAWYDLVESSGAESFFKSVVDGSTSIVESISKNLNGLLNTIKGFVVGIASYKLFKGWQAQGKAYIAEQSKQLNFLKKEYDAYFAKVNTLSNSSIRFDNTNGMAYGKLETLDMNALQSMRQYNDILIQCELTKRRLYGIKMMSDQELARIQTYNRQLDQTIAKTSQVGQNVKTISTFTAGLKNIVKTIGTTLKSMGIMAIVSAIIGLFTKIASDIKDIRAEWKRINEIYNDYVKGAKKTNESAEEQILLMKSHLKIVKDTTKSNLERLSSLNKINEMQGRINDNQLTLDDLEQIEGGYDKITEAVERWTQALKIQARVQYEASKYAEAKSKWEELNPEKKRLEGIVAEGEKYGANKKQIISGARVPNQYNSQKYVQAAADLKKVNAEMEQYEKIIAATEKTTEQLIEELYNLNGDDNGGGDGLQGLAKIMDDYTKDTEKLARQLKEGAISQKEYNNALNEIVQNAFKAAAATGEVSLDKIIEKQNSNKTLTAIEQWYVNLRDKALELAREAVLDGIAENIIKDIDDALAEEAKELEEELGKILENEEKRRQVDIDYAGATSELKYQNSRNKRDSTFDYKKSRADIFGEEADIANDNLDRVMDKIKELNDKQKELLETTGQGLDDIAKKELSSLQEYYRQLSKEAKTIEEAYRFEQIRQDIEDFEKEMTSGVFSGIENFATSLDRVVTGAQQLRDIMENVDSTGWEKMMGIVNYFFNVLNAITSVIETVNTLTEISNMLAGARSLLDEKKKADAAIELEGTVAQIAAEETLAAVKAKEATFEATITANKIAQAEASLGLATALGVEAAAYLAVASAAKKAAAASAAAAAAAMAGPAAPAAAAAAAAETIAAINAVLAGFAKGGIVGGNSTHGDRNIVRVNSGEMILNKAQQGTLFNMLNGKGGLGGNVQFKIHGADLVGTINNYNSRKRG